MDYEYIENIAEEMHMDRRDIIRRASRLGIKTVLLAVPPYGADVSSAVSCHDANRLREFSCKKTG